MQEKEIQTETPTETPEFVWDEGAWPIELPRLTKWFETVEGQEFKQKVESGEWSEQKAYSLLQEMNEGKSYDDVKKRYGWAGQGYRILDDLSHAVPEVADILLENPARVVTDLWDATNPEKLAQSDDPALGGLAREVTRAQGRLGQGIEEVTGSNALARIGMIVTELPKSFVIGIPSSSERVGRGEADLGDWLDVATFLSGITRAAMVNRSVRKFAGQAAIASAVAKHPIRTQLQRQVREAIADALINNKDKVSIPKKMIRDMLNDEYYGVVLQAKYRQLQKAGRISKNIEMWGEGLNLFVQNEELLLELLGYAGQRVLTDAVENFNQGGINMDKAIELAVRDFADQMEVEQGGTQPDTDAEDVAPPEEQEAAPDDAAPEEETPEETQPAPDEEVPDEEVADEAAEEADAETQYNITAASTEDEINAFIEDIASSDALQGLDFTQTAAQLQTIVSQNVNGDKDFVKGIFDRFYKRLGYMDEEGNINPDGIEPTDEDTEESTGEADGEAAEPEGEAEAESEEPTDAEAEGTEGEAPEEETPEETEPEARERLDLTQAQEQHGTEFSQEQVEAIDEPERVSVDVAQSNEQGSHFNIYQDFKNVGGAVRVGERTLYFANDPRVTEEEALAKSGSDTVYRTAKHQWSETDVSEAFYPTFDSLAEMLAYAEAETDARLGGDLYGTPDRMVYDSARKGKYHVRYELVNIHEVQGSHNLDGSENEVYPPHLQPRDQRGGTVDLEFLDSKAKDVAPEMLVDHVAQLTDGAPALSKEFPDASVSGSGRKWILMKMLQDYPDQWEKYRDYLKKNVKQYGYSEADVEADPESVLIRRIIDDVDEVQLAEDANKFVGLEDSSSEQASADAAYLKDNVMVEWKGTAGMTFEEALNHDDNSEFRQKLLANIPAGQRTGFLQSEDKDNKSKVNKISSRGAQRIRAMMLRYVFRGEYGLKMSEILIESKFGEIQNINNMLDVVTPHLALLESYFRTGRRDAKYSIAEELARAVGTLNTLKVNGDIVGDFFKQDLLFQPKTKIGDLNVPTLQMLYIMDHRIGAYQQLASVFMRYANSVMELDPARGQLFEGGFNKEAFFEKELYEIQEKNPDAILQKQLEAGEASQALNIVRAYVDNLMEQIRRQANQHSAEPVPPEPEEAQEQEEAPGEEETQEVDEAALEAIKEKYKHEFAKAIAYEQDTKPVIDALHKELEGIGVELNMDVSDEQAAIYDEIFNEAEKLAEDYRLERQEQEQAAEEQEATGDEAQEEGEVESREGKLKIIAEQMTEDPKDYVEKSYKLYLGPIESQTEKTADGFREFFEKTLTAVESLLSEETATALRNEVETVVAEKFGQEGQEPEVTDEEFKQADKNYRHNVRGPRTAILSCNP